MKTDSKLLDVESAVCGIMLPENDTMAACVPPELSSVWRDLEKMYILETIQFETAHACVYVSGWVSIRSYT